MSDPARGSVRTSTRTTDVSTPEAPPETPSVSATQSIPTGANRVVQPDEQAAHEAAAPPKQQPTTAPPKQPSAPATGAGRQPAAARTGAAPATAAGTPAASGVAGKAAAAGAAAKSAVTAGRKAAAAGRGPRRARLQLRHIDTWSAFKISLVLSIALFFVWLVAVGVLYGVLSGLGVFTTLNELFGQLSASGGGGGEFITPGLVFGAAAVIGGINVVLLTALGTVATFVYNLCSDLVGGLEVTLSERD